MSELEGKIGKVSVGQEEEKVRKMEVQELNKELRITIDKVRTQTEILVTKQQQTDKTRLGIWVRTRVRGCSNWWLGLWLGLRVKDYNR
jgi:hypothetical protein